MTIAPGGRGTLRAPQSRRCESQEQGHRWLKTSRARRQDDEGSSGAEVTQTNSTEAAREADVFGSLRVPSRNR
jgi:hypothetical protein